MSWQCLLVGLCPTQSSHSSQPTHKWQLRCFTHMTRVSRMMWVCLFGGYLFLGWQRETQSVGSKPKGQPCAISRVWAWVNILRHQALDLSFLFDSSCLFSPSSICPWGNPFWGVTTAIFEHPIARRPLACWTAALDARRARRVGRHRRTALSFRDSALPPIFTIAIQTQLGSDARLWWLKVSEAVCVLYIHIYIYRCMYMNNLFVDVQD